MFRVESGVKRVLRRSIVGLLAGVATLTVASNAADARRHHHQASQDGQQAQAGRHVGHHSIRESGYSPPSAAFVLDANTGKVLEESNADSLRHPASLTKIMTLYLLFERLDAGKIKLGTQMPVSEHAAAQAPTKLDLRPGQHIAVEDAIRGLVTRSANDAAVVIAEAVGGDEHTFAQMMTAKAHALGMSRTTYVNASGLPDDDQVTTARDQALLGRLIAERFPVYYTYFSTPSFVFRGEEIRNHNHLLGSVQGVDGIKTGYTNASGFNLVTSVRRNNRHIVAVVLGGSSAGARDARMRTLIEEHIAEASTHRTMTAVADAAAEPARTTPARAATAPAAGYALSSAASVPVPAPQPVTAAAPMLAPIAATPKPRSPVGSSEPIKPIAVKTIKVKLAPQHTAALAPAAAMIPIDEPTAPPAEPAKAAAIEPAPATAPAAEPAKLATAEPSPAPAATQPPAQPAPQPAAAAPAPLAASEPAAAAPVPAAKTEQPVQVAKIEPPAPPTRSLQVHTGWIIQIGAYESETEAKQHLDAAQSKAKSTLGHAERFTETVTKGDKTLYRARFAGLDKDEAEETCKRLRRNDIACITVKN
jgi:D-alanyl-D-alanine carboxypeptidase